MATLKPINKRDTWALPLERVVAGAIGAFFATLPLTPQKPPVPQQATPLEKALYDGSITLIGGLFRGRFSAGISRELAAMGGQYIGVSGGWQVPIDRIPYRIRRAAEVAADTKSTWHAALGSAVKTVAPVAPLTMEIAFPIMRDLAHRVTIEFKKTVGLVPATPDIEQRAKDFAARVDTALAGFTQTELRVVSKLVAEAVEDNWSISRLQKALEGRQGIGREKAKIVARQGMAETVTSLKADYYVSAGYPRYIWRSKGDSRVRPEHRSLDGTICEWKNPPVVDARTGYRGHPGQAANCRCESIPVEE